MDLSVKSCLVQNIAIKVFENVLQCYVVFRTALHAPFIPVMDHTTA
jgi:hypothetical protein